MRIHAALFCSALLFSINYIVSKVVFRSFSPLVIAFLRIAGGAMIFNLLLRERRAEPFTRDTWRRIIVYSFLGIIINVTLFLVGLQLTSAHVAGFLSTGIPIFVVGIAIAMGRERATPRRAGGIALAAIGAAMIIGVERFDGSARAVAGDLIIIVNCFSYALYLVLSKPLMTQHHVRNVLAAMFAFAAIVMLPIAALPLMHQRWTGMGPATWSAVAFLILGPTVGAYLINGWALRHADSSVVAAYSYLQPAITTILAFLFLGETIRMTGLVAGAMIILGVWMTSR
jgi:drug/metabolite transporter (DMT)-like permease